VSGAGLTTVKHLQVTQALHEYLVRSCTPPHPAVRSLSMRTARVGDAAGMALPVEQAALFTILAKLVSARLALDIGTFTGLSALALARGLVPGGKVITVDVTDKWAALARAHWEQAGVADRIEFRRGPAARLLQDIEEGSADIVFIDADKMNYPRYHARAVPLLRQGGLLLADNVLLDGHVVDPGQAPEGLARRCAEVMREFNATVAADGRLEAVMLPIADGLTIARKR
jgi:predicted O-methyltransferase YrrM